jgi:hypothetical protein
MEPTTGPATGVGEGEDNGVGVAFERETLVPPGAGVG